MAVIYQEINGPSLLGTLSGLASLAGTFIPGAQILTPLGLGLGAIDAAQQGDYIGMGNALNKIRSGDWKKQETQSNTKSNTSSTLKKIPNSVVKPITVLQELTDEELAQKWGPAFNGTYGTYRGITPWQL